MQVSYTTGNGRITVILEGKSQTDIFEQLAQFQEVFEHTTCKKNGKSSDEVKFVVREDDDANKYYELVCTSDDFDLRGTKLAFGQHKKGGTLFPKRKDKDGKWLPDGGWCRWDAKEGKNT